MTQDQLAGVIGSVMMLVLVGSSLAARRLPARQLIWMALGWLAIFAGGWLLVRTIGGIG